MIYRSHIILGYQFCYRYKYGNHKYIFKPSVSACKIIDQFLSLLYQEYGELNSLGSNYLIDYLLFQFNRVEGQSFKRFASIKNGEIQTAGRVQVVDIYSKKAFYTWMQRDKKFDYNLRHSVFTKTYKLDIYQLKEYLETLSVETQHTVSPIYEEVIKQRNFNSPEGLSQCLTHTTMFNPESYFCKICVNKDVCKLFQHQYLPHIYADRFRPVKLEHGYNN